MDSLAYVREAPEPDEAPPMLSRGALAWAKTNLFSSIGSTLVTLGCVALVGYWLPQLVAWATTRAIWSARDGAACRQYQDGACWAFVIAKWDYLRFGSYPVAERWRVDVAEAIGAALIIWLLWINAPRRVWGAFLLFVVYPILALILLRGSAWLGLPIVDTQLWGGIFVSLLTAVSESSSLCRSACFLRSDAAHRCPLSGWPALYSSSLSVACRLLRSCSWPTICCHCSCPKHGRLIACCVHWPESSIFCGLHGGRGARRASVFGERTI